MDRIIENKVKEFLFNDNIFDYFKLYLANDKFDFDYLLPIQNNISARLKITGISACCHIQMLLYYHFNESDNQAFLL